MADIDPNEIRDLTAAIQQLAATAEQVKSQFSGITRESKVWNDLLEATLLKAKDLPGHISDGKDLWKEMTKDAKTFKKVQEELTKLVGDELQTSLEKMSENLEANNASSEQWTKMLNEHAVQSKSINTLLQDRFNLATRLLEHQEKTNTQLMNANKLVKDLGDLIRNPVSGVDNMLGKLGELPTKLAKAKEETGSWGEALMKVAKDGFGKIMGPAKKLFAAGGFFLVGIAVGVAALTGFMLLFKNFYGFLDKEVIPSVADFNKQIGGTNAAAAQLKGQMSAVGAEFQLLGMTFQEGASLVRDFSESFKSVRISSEELGAAKKMIAEFGLSAQETGQLMLQFTKQTGNIAGLKASFMEAKAGAEAFGLPVNSVLRDMGQAPDVLARFGTQNSIEFAKATVKANSYGLAIKDVNRTFGDQFDTFEKSSEAAANFNAVLGTNINSFELMLETDPTKRLEMMRGELVKNGKEWENLTVFERNLIAENLGVDKSQAALILSSEKQRKKLEAQAAAAKKTADTNAMWEKGLNRIKRTLVAWGAEVDMLMRSVTEFTFALLGFEKPGKEIPQWTSLIAEGFKTLRTVFNDWTAMLRDEKPASTFIIVMQTIGATLQTLWDIAKVTGAVILDFIVAPFKIFDAFLDGFLKNLNAVYELFLDITQGNVIEGFKDFGKTIFKNMGGFLESFTKLGSFTEKALGSIFGENKSVDDAIITKAGKVIELNPSDNILATKSPITPTAVASAAPTALNAPASLRTPQVQAGRNQAPQAAQQATIEPKIEILRFEIDGKQIAEAQVRLSRA